MRFGKWRVAGWKPFETQGSRRYGSVGGNSNEWSGIRIYWGG